MVMFTGVFSTLEIEETPQSATGFLSSPIFPQEPEQKPCGLQTVSNIEMVSFPITNSKACLTSIFVLTIFCQ